ncbi:MULTISPECIES: hypothetical protein [Nocardia]|uniref:hypothetical protein n=1 Tax=Nocardia TaxID=1817 RepID=UPI000FDAB108|nr:MULTISPECIES: hypothetical protein [Nocardia]MBF6184135.1 hypothetical protein [Nocardia farcinica]MBF6247932.1 hypothetical protein [Nocardia elegans]MBF6290757.1 hypothetical protein [Nocardia farcinica]MBF6309978.1 hypothetical protein [Nocardia farcinica]MBF6377930.1 hypothetical protein [Nocardia farcinica]
MTGTVGIVGRNIVVGSAAGIGARHFTAVGTASIRMNVEVPAERVDVLDGLAARARAVSRE